MALKSLANKGTFLMIASSNTDAPLRLMSLASILET